MATNALKKTGTIACHNYIFGYGSLICSKSRKITAPKLEKKSAIPTVINHFQRSWNARIEFDNNDNSAIRGWTAMGIQPRRGHSCTGVLIEVNNEELANFDKRERGYDRVEVDLVDVYPHCQKDLEEKSHYGLCAAAERRNSKTHSCDDGNDGVKVWIYLPQKGGDGANEQYPILQSYLDIILRGCLSIGIDFTWSFLKSTHGWWNGDCHLFQRSGDKATVPEFLWIDDRQHPLYIRADADFSERMKDDLDGVIERVHAKPLEKRRPWNALLVAKRCDGSF
mmetsp:Transcript_18521/g.27994  ORF Transcript_18521/g.27994 Transcript_18521/m.27994 type:complete len:281 (+) Transcript_18521:198-1040(+)|eukprot:CAMPEP_0178921844 /NCGR_PEP_ID=MMETSP0786-20121207/15794_1 /TAXON_ID=186022 /ORGANISM="Thalassionema frauenfeldii, Strain CCMP 1798" /LENGTH=280 /DNA_ID=CAMNT_0020596083 /DNA_START=159 /DNA_END=1001 /DNA_ORIENTATION=+